MSAVKRDPQRTVLQPFGAETVPPATAAPAAPHGAGRLAEGVLLNNIYRVTRFLARGGMGEVYEGVNVNTDERVAIKVMLPHLAADPKIQAMFRKEARILTELAHPALVRYRVLAQEPALGVWYIVTEFIDGASLSDVLGKLKPDEAELRALIRRLAEGLGVAHAMGAVHRDMSPDNVLLPQGRLQQAKIIDFGIARESAVAHQTVVGDSFAGKLGYVAPEQFGDFGRAIGPWTDVYSLGLVALAVAAGSAPDMGVTLVEAVDRRREGVDLSPAPAALKPVLERMLAPDPANRFQSMDEVIAALDEATTLAAPPPRAPVAAPAPIESPAPKRPSPALLYGGAGLAVVLAAGAAFAFLSAGKPKPPPVQPVEPAPTVVAAAPAVPQPAPGEVAVAVESTLRPSQPLPAPEKLAKAPAKSAKRAPLRPVQGLPAPATPLIAAPAAPVLRAVAAPRIAVSSAAGQSTAPDKGTEACWKAVGDGWAFTGYAGRDACVAKVFEGACQVVHGRWGDQAMRRYDGRLEVRIGGPLARWKKVGASTCPASP